MYKESIHGNLVANQYGGVLILGPPNTGKSMLSYCLVQQHHFALIADDLVVLKKTAGCSMVGYLYNVNFFGWLYLKQQGFIHVSNAQKQSKITHIIYLAAGTHSNHSTTILGQKIAVGVINTQQRTFQQCADLFINNSLDFCILSP